MAKLLATLHFAACGSFQRTDAIGAGVSQSSFSSVLSKVLNAVSCRYIQFPRTQDTLNDTKNCFSVVAGFPKIIGAIDCTHEQLVPQPGSIFTEIVSTHTL